MAGIIPNEGRSKALVDFIKDSQTTLYLGLYTDVVQPTKTATLSTITELGALTGYARIALTNTDWTEANQEITNLLKTFTAGEDWGNVTGYFIATTLDNTGKLLAVESFSSPLNMTNTSTLDITPKIKGVDAV